MPSLRVFGSPEIISSKVIVALAKCCPLLEEVTLSGVQADNAALAALTLHCPQLRMLRLVRCPGSSMLAAKALRHQYPGLQLEVFMTGLPSIS